MNVLSCCSKVSGEQEQHSICSFWAFAAMSFPICMAVNPRNAPAVKYPEAELSAPSMADLADVLRTVRPREPLGLLPVQRIREPSPRIAAVIECPKNEAEST